MYILGTPVLKVRRRTRPVCEPLANSTAHNQAGTLDETDGIVHHQAETVEEATDPSRVLAWDSLKDT